MDAVDPGIQRFAGCNFGVSQRSVRILTLESRTGGLRSTPHSRRRAMSSTSKLRVAIPDRTDALDVVKGGVERATGFVAQPVLQEIDYTDLVVEVQLSDSNAADPRRVADTVGQASPDLDVLSSWKEADALPLPTVRAVPIVFETTDLVLPEVARRALEDELPTAQWLHKGNDVSGGDRSCWILAVPSHRCGGAARVGICHRRGYATRFSASEAESALWSLALETAISGRTTGRPGPP
jgi:hypothetical protein